MLQRLRERFSDQAVRETFWQLPQVRATGCGGLMMLNRLSGLARTRLAGHRCGCLTEAWQRFGGSVATHPLVVEQLADLARSRCVTSVGTGGEVKAAFPTWGRHLALSKDVLKRNGKKGLFDLGNAEIILPAAADAARRCAMPGVTCRR
jgi:hypothetical protein